MWPSRWPGTSVVRLSKYHWHQTFQSISLKYQAEQYSSAISLTTTGTHMPYGITVLPATRQRWHSCPYTSRSWYSIKRTQRDARLSWPSWLLFSPRTKNILLPQSLPTWSGSLVRKSSAIRVHKCQISQPNWIHVVFVNTSCLWYTCLICRH